MSTADLVKELDRIKRECRKAGIEIQTGSYQLITWPWSRFKINRTEGLKNGRAKAIASRE